MPSLVGADGCPDGWIAVIQRDSVVGAMVVPDVGALLDAVDSTAIVAIDVPIGLPETGARSCDLEARQLLKRPRASSVFPAPVRACLAAESYEHACQLHRAADGRSMARQAFGILRKIREVDAVLGADPVLQDRVREVHPEVSFALWSGGAAMRNGKKSVAGRAERERLIECVWPGLRAQLAAVVRGRYGADDLNDAFAALWTARRIARRQARVLGLPEVWDSVGLRMEIVA